MSDLSLTFKCVIANILGVKGIFRTVFFIVAIIFLFCFVYPQGPNRVVDFFNSKTSLNVPYISVSSFRLGLDLLGGTHLVYQADSSQLKGRSVGDAMQGVRDVIERRVNLFGVAEPLVQVIGKDKLAVELAGIRDINQAIRLIGETPFLEFRLQKPDLEEIFEAQQKGERLDEDLFQSTGLDGKHVKRAIVSFDSQTSQPQVSLDLNDEGSKIFADLTKNNIGKTLAIFLDGIAISLPVIQSEIPSGQALISGGFSIEDAKILVTRLNAGALPIPIQLISQQTIGASLGAESLANSLKAGVYGLIFVALFMILFYRLPGFVSVVALAIYILIVLAVYKFLPVTLTLAGIAGFILSLGMAVDANVLIFARMREELKANKGLSQSMDDGFHRAWLSVRDSHITTLIGALILYLFTTSIVKGFALTLSVGVLTSLLTATIITRNMLKFFTGRVFEKRQWLFR